MLPFPKNTNNSNDKKFDKTFRTIGIIVLTVIIVITSIVTPNNTNLGYKFFSAAFIVALIFVVLKRIIIIIRRTKNKESPYDEKGRWK